MSYPVEFREMIVSKAISNEMTQKELIEEYGIGLSTLHKWLHAYKNQPISKVTENEKPARDWSDEEKWQAQRVPVSVFQSCEYRTRDGTHHFGIMSYDAIYAYTATTYQAGGYTTSLQLLNKYYRACSSTMFKL